MDSQKGDDLMDSLEHGAAEALQIPRFDDGMVNIQGNFCTEGNVQSLAHFDSSIV